MDVNLKDVNRVAKKWYERLPVLCGLTLKCWCVYLLKGGLRLFDISSIINNSLIIILLTPVRVYEYLNLRKAIADIQLNRPPIFIIGCFRSGTTHLHNLLIQNSTFGYITTPEAIAFPYANLINTPGTFFNKAFRKFEMKRPMDNLVVSFRSPEEEECALASYYPWSMGPALISERHLKQYVDRFLLLSNDEGKHIHAWKAAYLYVLKKITFLRKGKQLLLKNPPNTARIKWILELFPDAKFIHIYRNPYEVFSSTVHLFKSIWQFTKMGFDQELLEECVFKLYIQLMEAYFDQKDLIPFDNLIEVKYEDLVKSPMTEVVGIFDLLKISFISEDIQALQNYLDKQKGYEKNKYTLSPEIINRIYQHLHFTIDKFQL